MATKHYTKRIAKSEKRARGALNLFNIAAETLETEARNQREVYNLLEAEAQRVQSAHEAALNALLDAHEERLEVLTDLKTQARRSGTRASEQAQKLRELFL